MNLFGNTAIQLNSFNPPIIMKDQEEMIGVLSSYNKGFESMVYYYVGESATLISIPNNFSDSLENGYLYYYNGAQWLREKISDIGYNNPIKLKCSMGYNGRLLLTSSNPDKYQDYGPNSVWYFACTNYIPINIYKYIQYTAPITNDEISVASAAFYSNTTKNSPIEIIKIKNDEKTSLRYEVKTIEVPSNAKYVRFCYWHPHIINNKIYPTSDDTGGETPYHGNVIDFLPLFSAWGLQEGQEYLKYYKFHNTIDNINNTIDNTNDELLQLKKDVFGIQENLSVNFVEESGAVVIKESFGYSVGEIKTKTKKNPPNNGWESPYWYTNFINIDGYDKIKFTSPIVTKDVNYGCCFYEENKSTVVLTEGLDIDADVTDKSQDVKKRIERTTGIEPYSEKPFRTKTIIVPNNAKKARFTFWQNCANDFKIWGIKGENTLENKVNNNTEKIDDLKKEILGEEYELDCDYDSSSNKGSYVAKTGALGTPGSDLWQRIELINISNYDKVKFYQPIARIISNDDNPGDTIIHGYCFYKEDSASNENFISIDPPGEIAFGGSKSNSKRYKEKTVTVPTGAKYIGVTYWAAGKINEPTIPAFKIWGIKENKDSLKNRIDELELSVYGNKEIIASGDDLFVTSGKTASAIVAADRSNQGKVKDWNDEENTTWCITDFINIENYDQIKFPIPCPYKTSNNKTYIPFYGCCFYKNNVENKENVVKAIVMTKRETYEDSIYEEKTLNVPKEVKYARFTYYQNSKNNFYVIGYKNENTLENKVNNNTEKIDDLKKEIFGIKEKIDYDTNFVEERVYRVSDGAAFFKSDTYKSPNIINIEGYNYINFTQPVVYKKGTITKSSIAWGYCFYNGENGKSLPEQYILGDNITVKNYPVENFTNEKYANLPDLSHDFVNISVKVPENAKYIGITWWAELDESKFSITGTKGENTLEDKININTENINNLEKKIFGIDKKELDWSYESHENSKRGAIYRPSSGKLLSSNYTAWRRIDLIDISNYDKLEFYQPMASIPNEDDPSKTPTSGQTVDNGYCFYNDIVSASVYSSLPETTEYDSNGNITIEGKDEYYKRRYIPVDTEKQKITYSDGIERYTIKPVTVPEGAKYIGITYWSQDVIDNTNNESIMPSFKIWGSNIKNSLKNKIENDIKELKTEIYGKEEELVWDYEPLLDDQTASVYRAKSGALMGSKGDWQRIGLIDVSNYNKVKFYQPVLMEETGSIQNGYCFYTKDFNPTIYLSKETSLEKSNYLKDKFLPGFSGEEIDDKDGIPDKKSYKTIDPPVTVPDGAKYIGVTYYPNNKRPEGVPEFRIWGIKDEDSLKNKIEKIRGIGLDQVSNQPNGEKLLAMYKRAHLMSDFKWKPLKPVPVPTDPTGISTSRIQTGIPYSSAKEFNKMIPTNVSFKTFDSAVKNKYSLIYTEDTLKSRSCSSYGNTYSGTNCGSYFGTVCSQFVCYALGVPVSWSTYHFEWLGDENAEERSILNALIKISSADVHNGNIKPMDVFLQPRIEGVQSGHATLISDVKLDYLGNIDKIYITESTPTLRRVKNDNIAYYENNTTDPYVYMTRGTRTTEYTLTTFLNRFDEKHGKMYRYKNLYVPISDNINSFFAYDNIELTENNSDICTYAGDYAAFGGQDFPIYINFDMSYDYSDIDKGPYTKMIIKNEDNLTNKSISIDLNNYKIQRAPDKQDWKDDIDEWQPSTTYAKDTIVKKINGSNIDFYIANEETNTEPIINWTEINPTPATVNEWQTSTTYAKDTIVKETKFYVANEETNANPLISSNWTVITEEWQASTTYAKNIVVKKTDGSNVIFYQAKKATNANLPTKDEDDNWKKLGISTTVNEWQTSTIYAENTVVKKTKFYIANKETNAKLVIWRKINQWQSDNSYYSGDVVWYQKTDGTVIICQCQNTISKSLMLDRDSNWIIIRKWHNLKNWEKININNYTESIPDEWNNYDTYDRKKIVKYGPFIFYQAKKATNANLPTGDENDNWVAINEWQASTTYAENIVVKKTDGSNVIFYQAKKATNANLPTKDEDDNWKKLGTSATINEWQASTSYAKDTIIKNKERYRCIKDTVRAVPLYLSFLNQLFINSNRSIPPKIGKYSAHLENDDKTLISNSTYFEIIIPTIELDCSGKFIFFSPDMSSSEEVIFDSNCNPNMVYVEFKGGAPYAVKQLTAKNRENGKVEGNEFHPWPLGKDQRGLTAPYATESDYYMDVDYQGDYGIVTYRKLLAKYKDGWVDYSVK